MDKKASQRERQVDGIKSSLTNLIDARVNLEKEVVDLFHSSVKDAMDEDNRITLVGLITSAINNEAKMLKKIKENIEEKREPAE